MREDEIKRSWEKIENTAENFQAEIKTFPHILKGVIATLGENALKSEVLTTIKEELERVEIHVSTYEPFGSVGRNIMIKVPSCFSLENGGTKEYNMENNYNILKGIINITLTLEDFEKMLIKNEMENMPGEPSSANHDGLAKNLLVAMHNFKIALLEYADIV